MKVTARRGIYGRIYGILWACIETFAIRNFRLQHWSGPERDLQVIDTAIIFDKHDKY